MFLAPFRVKTLVRLEAKYLQHEKMIITLTIIQSISMQNYIQKIYKKKCQMLTVVISRWQD